MLPTLRGRSFFLRAARALLTIVVPCGCADTAPEVVGPASDSAVETVLDAGKGTPLADSGRGLGSIDAGLDAGRFSQLVDQRAWRRYDAAVDPLRDHQPESIDCKISATYVEYGSFEIDTTRCNYLLAETPSLRGIDLGTEVHLSLLHYDLLAPQPAQAHIAVLFGDALQWETLLPVPSPGNVIDVRFQATKELSFGEPIRLHLHNHGGNTYLLQTLEAADLTL